MTPDLSPWPERIERRVQRWVASGSGPAWVVAVSGGGDSVGLLRVLHGASARVGLNLSVAHLDHGARGEAGRRDAAFVADLAGSLGLPVDLGQWRPTRAGHFEADARRARFDWLHEVARNRGAGAVAVGHTSDDQAETVLHRVVRGTGIHGLAGIPPRRTLGDGITLVRPLLDVSREQVRTYLAGLGQPFHNDATNADTSRTRARIRHDLLPKLAADYNPKVAEALVRLAGLASASTRAYRERVREAARAATLDSSQDTVRFTRGELATLSEFLRAEVLRLAWRRAGWPEVGMAAGRWHRLAQLARRTREGKFDVGGGVEAVTGPLVFELRRPTGSVSVTPEPRPLDVPGSAPWPGGRVVATLDPSTPRDETIDLDCVSLPLCVRAPVPGDRFNPLGMGTQGMPLNDFFRGRGVAQSERSQTPLVCDRSGILWVVGHRISDSVKWTDQTVHPLGLRWEPDPGDL